jgi:preprotein translocase subunit SecG
MFLFLTVVQALVALLLVGVILVQKSEGGGLGVGGSPSGLMSARGAANFLTRATGVLATLFVVLSIILAAMAVNETTGRDIDTSLQRQTAPASAPAAPAPPADPLAGAANPATTNPATPGTAAQPSAAPTGQAIPADPLSGAAKQ